MTLRKALFYLILLALQLALVEGILQAYYRITNGDYLAITSRFTHIFT